MDINHLLNGMILQECPFRKGILRSGVVGKAGFIFMKTKWTARGAGFMFLFSFFTSTWETDPNSDLLILFVQNTLVSPPKTVGNKNTCGLSTYPSP